MDKEALRKHLLTISPKIREDYKEKIFKNGMDEYYHIIFGDVLTPRIIFLLDSSNLTNEEKKELKRICLLLEQMANSENTDVRNILAVSVLEVLIDEQRWIKQLANKVGPQTRKIMSDMNKFWRGTEIDFSRFL